MKLFSIVFALLFVSSAWAAKPMCDYTETDSSERIPFETVEKVYETEDQESFITEKLNFGDLRFEISSGEGFEELLIEKNGETLVRTSWSLDQGMTLSQDIPGGSVFCLILSVEQRHQAEHEHNDLSGDEEESAD